MPQTWLANPLVEKLVLVAVGAILGFLSSYLLDRMKAKREPHRRISWDASLQRALIEGSKDISSKLRFMYGNVEVTAPTHIRCTISNTGNRVVKDHELRFPFPPEVRLLEHYLDPLPEPELGVEEIGERSHNQCRYRIAHLERDQAVTFNFVTTGGALPDWRPRSFNKEGDVEFQRRDVSVVKDDQEHLFPFIAFLLLLTTVPQAFSFLGLAYGSIAKFILSVGLLAAVVPHVRPVVRIIERLLTRKQENGGTNSNGVYQPSGGYFFQANTIHEFRVVNDNEGQPKKVHADNNEVTIERQAPAANE